ncbi:MAG: hypothetical protein ACXWAT_12730 [Methylobacter sp.]
MNHVLHQVVVNFGSYIGRAFGKSRSAPAQLNFEEREFDMWIPDVSTQPVETPTIYLAANAPSSQKEEATLDILLGLKNEDSYGAQAAIA